MVSAVASYLGGAAEGGSGGISKRGYHSQPHPSKTHSPFVHMARTPPSRCGSRHTTAFPQWPHPRIRVPTRCVRANPQGCVGATLGGPHGVGPVGGGCGLMGPTSASPSCPPAIAAKIMAMMGIVDSS